MDKRVGGVWVPETDPGLAYDRLGAGPSHSSSLALAGVDTGLTIGGVSGGVIAMRSELATDVRWSRGRYLALELEAVGLCLPAEASEPAKEVYRPSPLALALALGFKLPDASIELPRESLPRSKPGCVPGRVLYRDRGGRGWKAAHPSPPEGIYMTNGAADAAAHPPLP